MKRFVIIAGVFAAAAAPVSAQVYKCSEGGRVVFSDAPCAGAGAIIDVRPASGSANAARARAAAAAEAPINASTNPQAVLDGMERARRLRDLEHEIRVLENAIDGDVDRMNAEIAGLKNKKRHANNNLAGATWEASISQEMQAVAARYQAKAAADAARLNGLRLRRDAMMR